MQQEFEIKLLMGEGEAVVLKGRGSKVDYFFGEETTSWRTIILPDRATIDMSPALVEHPKTRKPTKMGVITQNPPIVAIDSSGKPLSTDANLFGIKSYIDYATGEMLPPGTDKLMVIAVGMLGYQPTERVRSIQSVAAVLAQANLGLAQPTTAGVKGPQKA